MIDNSSLSRSKSMSICPRARWVMQLLPHALLTLAGFSLIVSSASLAQDHRRAGRRAAGSRLQALRHASWGRPERSVGSGRTASFGPPSNIVPEMPHGIEPAA